MGSGRGVDRATSEKINPDSCPTGETEDTGTFPWSRSVAVIYSASHVCFFGQAFISQKFDVCLLWTRHCGKGGR